MPKGYAFRSSGVRRQTGGLSALQPLNQSRPVLQPMATPKVVQRDQITTGMSLCLSCGDQKGARTEKT